MSLFHLYSQDSARKIIDQNSALIDSICNSYHLPSAYLNAILRMELPELNLFDKLADVLVAFNWARYKLFGTFDLERHTRNPLKKFDSSTGYAQIFAQVAINADLKLTWTRLHRDKVFNLSCAALNLIHAAFERTGRIDFGGYNEREIKMILSRYNGNAELISPYGEKAYLYYLEYVDRSSSSNL